MNCETEYGHLWVVVNPAGGLARNFNAFRESLGGLPHKVIETSPNPLETQQALAENVDHEDILAVYTGDGGFRQVGIALANLGLQAQAVPFDGGTTNNDAEAFNPRKSRSLPTILAAGRSVAVPLLQTSWSNPDGSVYSHESIGDSAFHAPASALEAMDQRKARNNQRPHLLKRFDQAVTTIGSIARHEALTVEFEDRDPVRMASIIFAHSDVFAGEGRLHVTPFGTAYEMVCAPSEGRAATAWRMLKLARGALYGEISEEPITFTMRRDNRGPIRFELDGELEDGHGCRLMVPSDARVTVGVDENRQFRTRTTRPL